MEKELLALLTKVVDQNSKLIAILEKTSSGVRVTSEEVEPASTEIDEEYDDGFTSLDEVPRDSVFTSMVFSQVIADSIADAELEDEDDYSSD